MKLDDNYNGVATQK